MAPAALAACGSAASQPHPAASTSAAAPAATAAASCTTQTYTWAHSGGGIAQATAVGRDSGNAAAAETAAGAALQSGGDASSALSALTSAASQLGADASAALANPPPSCIPGEAGPYRTGMSEYGQAAQDLLGAAAAAQGGNVSGAISDLQASSTALGKGAAGLARATAAINAFNGG
jgi:hypothetical protein